MTSRHQLGWRTPSRHSDKWQSTQQRGRKELAGYKEGEDRKTKGISWRWWVPARVQMVEGAKLSIEREDLWELRKILGGHKGSLRENCKCQTEANDRVWVLNRDEESGFRLPATSPMWFKDLTNTLRIWRTPHGERPKGPETWGLADSSRQPSRIPPIGHIF